MAKKLPVPPALQHLIEKRENTERRTQQEQRSEDVGRAEVESTEQLEETPEDDRRSSIKNKDGRRQGSRRREDQG